eukprot:s4057_g7.t1
MCPHLFCKPRLLEVVALLQTQHMQPQLLLMQLLQMAVLLLGLALGLTCKCGMMLLECSWIHLQIPQPLLQPTPVELGKTPVEMVVMDGVGTVVVEVASCGVEEQVKEEEVRMDREEEQDVEKDEEVGLDREEDVEEEKGRVEMVGGIGTDMEVDMDNKDGEIGTDMEVDMDTKDG